jgi:hypothetical protein
MKLGNLMLIACLTVSLIGQAPAQDDKPEPVKPTIKKKVADNVLRLFGLKPKEIGQGRFVIRVATDSSKQVEQLKEILQKHGLKGAKLEKAMSQIKALLNKPVEHRLRVRQGIVDRQVEFKIEAKVVVVGPDGQRREIDFSKSNDPQKADPKAEHRTTLTIREFPLDAKLRDILKDKFKHLGLTKEQAEQLQKAYETARGEVGAQGFERIVVWRPSKIAIDPKLADRTQLLFVAIADENNRFMVGLNCVVASNVLRSQLRIGESGLVVESVLEGTPAKKAGVEKLDVLTKAGDSSLGTLKDLVEAVQKAGKDKKPLALTVIRQGKERKITVTPVQRKVVKVESKKTLIDGRVFIRNQGLVNTETKELPKGVRIIRRVDAGHDLESMSKQIEQLQRQVRELQQRFKQPKSPKKAEQPR